MYSDQRWRQKLICTHVKYGKCEALTKTQALAENRWITFLFVESSELNFTLKKEVQEIGINIKNIKNQ